MVSELPKIKSLLSGKNPIKHTPKGIKYRFFHVKRRQKNTKKFNGRGFCMFFSDYGNKACFENLKYDFIGGKDKFNVASNQKIWFKIINNRMYVSDNHAIRNGQNQTYRIISNNPSKISFSAGGRTNEADENLKVFLLKWVKKNGVKVKQKWYKYNFHTVCLLLCYPEYEYFLDFCPEIIDKTYIIPSILSSDFNGIKGLNHGLDRFCGFHGKKLKTILKSDRLINKLSVAKTLKNLVTNDDILVLLENNIRFEKEKIIRYFLKNYGRDTIMNWLNPPNDNPTVRGLAHGNLTLITDTSNQYWRNHKENPNNKMVLPDSNNLEDIHNIVTGNYRRIEQTRILEQQEKIDYTEDLKKYSKYEFVLDDLEVILPKTPQEIINTSQLLNNCLTSYVNWHTKSGLILLVNKNNILKYAISINFSNVLEQFYGKFNVLPDKEDYIRIKDYLVSNCGLKSSNLDFILN